MSKTTKDGKDEREKRAGKRPRRVETHPEKGGHRNVVRELEEESIVFPYGNGYADYDE